MGNQIAFIPFEHITHKIHINLDSVGGGICFLKRLKIRGDFAGVRGRDSTGSSPMLGPAISSPLSSVELRPVCSSEVVGFRALIGASKSSILPEYAIVIASESGDEATMEEVQSIQTPALACQACRDVSC